jgi:hypothetical protein
MLAKLQTLFAKVQKGELSVDDAMSRATALLGDDAASSPNFMGALKSSLESAPRFAQQIELPYDLVEVPVMERLETAPRVPRPHHPMPPAEQYRVEVWRESKKAARHVTITKI